MTLRRLVPSDAPGYRALMLEAYERHPDAFTSSVAERAALPMSWWEKRLSTDVESSDVVLGAFEGDALAGVAGLTFETREKARHKCTLFGMYVPQRFRQGGLGKRLVAAAVDLARSRSGVRVVQLTVTQGNAAALSLYERCGFAAFGIEPMAVALDGAYVSKVHMWRQLENK